MQFEMILFQPKCVGVSGSDTGTSRAPAAQIYFPWEKRKPFVTETIYIYVISPALLSLSIEFNVHNRRRPRQGYERHTNVISSACTRRHTPPTAVYCKLLNILAHTLTHTLTMWWMRARARAPSNEQPVRLSNTQTHTHAGHQYITHIKNENWK